MLSYPCACLSSSPCPDLIDSSNTPDITYNDIYTFGIIILIINIYAYYIQLHYNTPVPPKALSTYRSYVINHILHHI